MTPFNNYCRSTYKTIGGKTLTPKKRIIFYLPRVLLAYDVMTAKKTAEEN
jgi:hypothetical protein